MTLARMMMALKGLHRPTVLSAALAFMLAVPAAAVAPSGFTLEVLAHPATAPSTALKEAIMRALPEELTDAAVNFTQNKDAAVGRAYRIVVAVHPAGWDMPDPCGTTVLEVPQADLSDIGSTKMVSAALCEDSSQLTRGTQRSIGTLGLAGPGFRHLVVDVVQQLFPLGFGELPR